MVPESFGKYGWYRGDSINDNMNVKVEYANSNKCVECHENIYSVSHQSEMPQPGNDSREFCGLCHFKRVARPRDFPQIDPESGHGEDLKCSIVIILINRSYKRKIIK